MEKSSKKEYIAVPTSDVEAAALPAYEETDPTTTPKSQKRNSHSHSFFCVVTYE